MILLNTNLLLDRLTSSPTFRRSLLPLRPREINELLVLRAAGVPPPILREHAENILKSLRGSESILSKILKEEVTIAPEPERVINFYLTLNSPIEDLENSIPSDYNISLYRNGDKIHVTAWR